MKKKNYPLYETTKFRDFRVMTEQAATLHGSDTAFSYKKNPNDAEVVKISFDQARNDIRNFGTECIAMGLRDKKCAIIGTGSVGWIYSYFALMSVGAVTVPIDKELPAADMASIIERAGCSAIFYGAEIGGKLDYLKANTKAEIYVCINGEQPTKDGAAADLTAADLIARGDEKFAAGDNSYYDYEIDPDRLASIVFTSGTTGYLPNPSELAIADTWHGPYRVLGDPHPADETHTSFHSQVSSVFKVPGKQDLYIALADRWLPQKMSLCYDKYRVLFERLFGSNPGMSYPPLQKEEIPATGPDNTSLADYVWLPLRFDGEMAYIDWLDEWKIEDYD